jgi:hypothetical protein
MGERSIKSFVGERDHLEDLGVDGRINITLGLYEAAWESVDYTDLPHKRDRWWALWNGVKNFQFQ